MTVVDFYFDFVSPYAYFASLRIADVCARHGATLSWHPVLFAGLLDHWGQLGPAEVPPKRTWVFRDAFRYAALHGIPLVGPPLHPFNPLLALRAVVAAGPEAARAAAALFRAAWSEGRDLADARVVADALDASGLDGPALTAAAEATTTKEALKSETAAAVARGVFGVPTICVGDELFWGSDRFDHIELTLAERDPIDHAAVARALARGAGAQRPRSRPT